ncbi:XkdX family protein [Sporosarcina sp. FSL K6-6792]
MWFNTVKRYYDNGHASYTDESLKVFVKANMIIAEQYTEITGIEYVA